MGAGSALADEPKLTPLKPATIENGSLDAFIRANVNCTSFSNKCEICRRAEAGTQCSTPGIACQPQAWRCTDPAVSR